MARPAASGPLLPSFQPSTLMRLRQHLAAPQDLYAAIAAPCGNGGPLLAITSGTRAFTYGLDARRPLAREARQVLGRVVPAPLEEVRAAHDEGSLLVTVLPRLAPGSVREMQREATRAAAQVRTMLAWLKVGGVLVLLAPVQQLSPSLLGLLSTRCADVQAFRPSNAQVDRDMVLVLARKTASGGERDAEVHAVLAAARQDNLPVLPAQPETRYAIPVGRPLTMFRSTNLDPQVLESEVADSPLWPAFWRDMDAAATRGDIRPPLPLHKGHLGLLLAAGECDGLMGQGAERHLVRGFVRKRQTTDVSYENGATRSITREHFTVVIKLLFPDGTLRRLGDATATGTDPIDDALDQALGTPSTDDGLSAPDDEDVVINTMTGRRRRAFDL